MPIRLSISLLLSTVLLLTGFMAAAPPRPSPLEQIRQLTQSRKNKPAVWGVSVMDAGSGEHLIHLHDEQLFVPASIMKIVTVLAVMKTYSLDHRFQTEILTDVPPGQAGIIPGNLIVRGAGDPSWSFEFYENDYDKPMEAFVAALQGAYPLREIKGDLIADDTRFLYKPYGPSWSWEVFQWRYGSKVSALTLNDNLIRIQLRPTRLGQPVSITTYPSFYSSRIRCETITSSRASLDDLVAFKPFDSDLYYLAGEYPVRQHSWNLKITVSDPALFFGEWLKEALRKSGVTVQGQVAARHRTHYKEATPLSPKLTRLAAIPGEDVSTILSPTMKKSINLYAELLLRNMGADSDSANPDERESGIQHIYSLWPSLIKPDVNIAMADGSGLSRRNLISPDLIATLLAEQRRDSRFAAFLELFPVSGREGTLKNRLKNHLAGRVFGKTGLLEQAASMAGYIRARSGRWLAFCIITNNHPAHKTTARWTIDGIVRIIHDSY
jgi:D-alanyl-D-alanine carboxypeptidase/D-alanyl-D-alanine-endopeptidase (penicillin-binding protein 4)